MKTILIAATAAFAFATPAAAQPASAPAPTATCTPEHAAMGHCVLSAQPSRPQPHQGHQVPGQAMNHGQTDCCRDADGNGKMDCCENMGAAVQSPANRQAPAPQPQPHQGH